MNKIHYNAKHLHVIRIDGNICMIVAGRGTGKSTSIIAPRAIRCVFSMPRSLGLFVASSFTQLKTKTLPPVIEGWRLMGFIRDRDYVIGKRGPSHWPTPYFMPVDDLSNFIHFRNGSGILMVSMKNEGSANGLSCDWIIGDEVKFWKRVRFVEEVMPTMRGSTSGPARALWSKKALYKSQMLCTDMPSGRSSDWIFEYEKLMDRGQVKLIEFTYNKMAKKMMAFHESKSESYRTRLAAEINALQNELDDYRKDCVFYMEASAIDNIEVLGKSYLKRMKQELPPLVYDTSVLNKRIKRGEHNFYPHFDPDIHGRDWSNDDLVNKLDYDIEKLINSQNDCRLNLGIWSHIPLEVGLDNGGNFNCVVTGQHHDHEIRVHSGHHVSNPSLVRDLANDWCRYYKHHKTREMIYYYDHTAYPTYGTTSETYMSQWIDTIQANGWKVYPIYIGKTSDYEIRHTLLSDVFRGLKPDLPDFSYNINKCHEMEVSIMNADVKSGTTKLEKDKSSEKPTSEVRPEYATHYSDAFDTFMVGTLKHKHSISQSNFPGGVIG
jgi:hypothetical protein